MGQKINYLLKTIDVYLNFLKISGLWNIKGNILVRKDLISECRYIYFSYLIMHVQNLKVFFFQSYNASYCLWTEININTWLKLTHNTINIDWFGWFMVLNATFNNISLISWQSVWLVEETGVSGEKHWPVANNGQTFINITL